MFTVTVPLDESEILFLLSLNFSLSNDQNVNRLMTDTK